MCGFEWECELNGADDEDDDTLRMGWQSTEQSKWDCLAPVVQLKRSHQQASPLIRFRRCSQAVAFDQLTRVAKPRPRDVSLAVCQAQ